MKEKWTPIEDYPGYEISTLGRIRSFKRFKEGRLLSPGKSANGYLNATLYRYFKRRTHSIHRMVAKSFIENPENKPHINHKDSDKTNNRVDNLEWCTPSENIIHAYDNGMIQKSFGERNGNAKLTTEQVKHIKQLRGVGITQQRVADMFNSSQCNIGRIWREEQWAGV